MTEDNFESFLQREARDYNSPPPTPRDAMWARIEAERSGQLNWIRRPLVLAGDNA